MIDFDNKKVFKLKQNDKYAEKVAGLLVEGEKVIGSYKSLKDGVVFTNFRIIAVNREGMMNSNADFTSIPYAKITLYSIHTASTFEKIKMIGADAELDVYIVGLGRLRFEFKSSIDIYEISQYISNNIIQKGSIDGSV